MPLDSFTATRANPVAHMLACNLRMEKLRFLFRLAMDLHYLDLSLYEFAAIASFMELPARQH